MAMTRVVLLAAAALVAIGSAMPALAQDQAPSGDAAAGKHLYLSTGCFYCHGSAGQGGAYNREAPILAKTAMPFVGFKFQLRSPGGDMPAYVESVMSDQQIADIYAFLQALPGRREVKDLPILSD
jgi:mono/diheme cytochrome c family protein